MAESKLTPNPSGGQESVPPWRDIRIIGIFAQIAFVVLVIMGAMWLLGNVTDNLGRLGGFRCPDGTSSFSCGYNFLKVDSQFDISESVIDYDPSDTYGRALLVGLMNTIKVGVLGIIFATILGVLAGIARLSDNWLVSKATGWYIDLMRNTPLLLQLFFIYFGVILLFPPIRDAIQLGDLPVYLSQRGINMPGPVFLPSFATWLAFVVAGIILAFVIWILLGRREERVGKASNRAFWVVFGFFTVSIIGWFVASNSNKLDQSFMIAKSERILAFTDLADNMERRLGAANLNEIDLMVEEGELTSEEVDEAAYTLCVISESASEVNFTAELRRLNIPYTVNRSTRPDQATAKYAAGECEIYVADTVILTGERPLLEDPFAQAIVPTLERPVRISIPEIEGLNFVGGIKISPNFAALLIGLVLFTGAYIAEIVRAGIQSVSKGQSEAARALGLSESQRLRLVVLPQAMRVIIPPLTSQYLNLVKNSSLAIAVGYPDLFAVAFTTLNQSGQAIQVFLMVMAAYLTLSLSISALLNWYNKRIALVER
ncbi:MAG: ABC transporter permease subunit [Anaerolineae bacterium]|nr:ABC transporter permease subunit [Anaerolineae bacterium]MCO5189087.1 ABC transporter permease subunit [Anaerolineae bacterium]MCO5193255.1 ABC transporter permease subunit [Anaerolineae bacterium]MCO5198201.1 ABC transporter permease subunit [Anaerolineae bacterium]MCO5205507.1 ABC transporter permease subunit [Anaerolineae bacterium]